MAKNLPDEVLGKKIVYCYSKGVGLSIILSTLVIGIYVATLFLPYNGFIGDIGAVAAPTGLDFFKYVIGSFTGTPNEAMEALKSQFSQMILDGNGIVPVAISIWYYFMTAALLFMGIFSFVLLIGVFKLLFTGHLNHWKLPYSMSKRVFLHSVIFYGTICLVNLWNYVLKEKIIGIAPSPSLPCFFTYIFFGLLLLLVIFIHITYSKCFKNRVYIRDEEQLNQFIKEYNERNGINNDENNNANDNNQNGEAQNSEASAHAPVIEIPTSQAQPVITPVQEAPSDNNTSSIINSLLVAGSQSAVPQASEPEVGSGKTLPRNLTAIGGHAFSQNTQLEEANIPNGITTLGPGAFANCVNLRVLYLPESIKKIDYNCFFNCIRLESITYGGTKVMWSKIKRGSNWLTSAGTNIIKCTDGRISVDRTK